MLPLKTMLQRFAMDVSYEVRAVEGIVNETSDLSLPNKLFAM